MAGDRDTARRRLAEPELDATAALLGVVRIRIREVHAEQADTFGAEEQGIGDGIRRGVVEVGEAGRVEHGFEREFDEAGIALHLAARHHRPAVGFQPPEHRGDIAVRVAPDEPGPDLYVITYGISPGYAPLVGDLHDSLAPKPISPSIHTPWMRPNRIPFNASAFSGSPLCLVSGASGGAATALMTLFGRRIPEGQLDESLNRFLIGVKRQFHDLYGEIEILVSKCAVELIADVSHGREYEPANMNCGAWSAIRRLCNDRDKYEELLHLLAECGFVADISLVLHARSIVYAPDGLSDPFKSLAGPLLSLINYPLLEALHDRDQLISLDSETTSIRWIEMHSPSGRLTSRAVVTRRREDVARQTPVGDMPSVRDLWMSEDHVLAIEKQADRVDFEWLPAEAARLPSFTYIFLSHGPRPDANLSALAAGSDRVDAIQFLRALADG